MRLLFAAVTTLAAAGATGSALAQAVKDGQEQAWGIYSAKAANGKVCYVMSVPSVSEPASVDHGAIYFYITRRPDQSVAYEPQFIASYEFKENSEVSLTVGDKTYAMFFDNARKSAWVKNAAEEAVLVDRMKSGQTMKVSAVSKRGTQTSYTFSLKGLTKALAKIAACK